MRVVATGLPALKDMSSASATPSPSSTPFDGPSEVKQSRPELSNSRDVGSGAGLEVDLGGASVAPDISDAFRSEMAALIAFYASRIGAARMTVSASIVGAIVQSIMREQTIALKALLERWQAATQKQRDERPMRPKGPSRDQDPAPV